MELFDIYKRLIRETSILVDTVELTTKIGFTECCPSERHHCIKREMCMIRMVDAWARFCREFVVVSAYAEPVTLSRGKVPRVKGINKRSKVIPSIMATYKKRIFEPKWHDTIDCLDAAKRIGINNYQSLLSGLGVYPSPVDDMVTVRNYFAHHESGILKNIKVIAERLGISATGRPDRLIIENVPPGVSVVRLWVSQLHSMAFQAIQ